MFPQGILIILAAVTVQNFSLQSNQALRQGEMLNREQLQFLTLGAQGELADPERKELILKVNNLLKVKLFTMQYNVCLIFKKEHLGYTHPVHWFGLN